MTLSQPVTASQESSITFRPFFVYKVLVFDQVQPKGKRTELSYNVGLVKIPL